VNADWIVEYNTAITTAKGTAANTDTVVEIQAIVDAQNSAKIAAANTAATTVSEQNAVTELIKGYTVEDVAPATGKADALKASEVKSAIFGVKEATTAASVYNALVKLTTVDSTNFPASLLNTNLKADYFTAKNAATINGTTTVSALKAAIVDAADAAALEAAATGIVNLTATSTTADVKAALQKLADVTSHATDKFEMTKVKDGSLASYLTVLVSLENDAVDSASEVTALIAGVNSEANEATNLATIKNASSTVVEVRDALTELAAGVTTPNTVTTAFLNASSQVKLEVAQLVMDNRSSLAAELSPELVTADAETATYANAVIETALAAHATKVGQFNDIGNLGDQATTITSTKGHLDTFAYAPYAALNTSQKLAVAEQINKLTKSAGTPAVETKLNFADADAVTTLKQANDYIDAAISAVLNK
jgi:hypothetical protein